MKKTSNSFKVKLINDHLMSVDLLEKLSLPIIDTLENIISKSEDVQKDLNTIKRHCKQQTTFKSKTFIKLFDEAKLLNEDKTFKTNVAEICDAIILDGNDSYSPIAINIVDLDYLEEHLTAA